MAWYEMNGETPAKDEPMTMDSDNFHRIIAMHTEIIMEQKAEISKLKHRANKLEAKMESMRNAHVFRST